MDELEIKAQGRVQGVSFRANTRKKAVELNLLGCVFNRSDGGVSVIAQGKKDKLLEFLGWVQSNPGFSKVESLYYKWGKPSQKFSDFLIVKEDSFLVDKMKSVLNLGKYFVRKDSGAVPNHIAIIPDGNRRWARKRGFLPQFGHYTSSSFRHLDDLFEEAKKQGVKYMTLWGFSTENWKRDSTEVKAIFDLLLNGVDHFIAEARAQKIRFRHIGRRDRLPARLVQALKKLEEETRDYTDFNVQLCLDYGGNDEVIRAVNKILGEGKREIDETKFLDYLDSRGLPPLDLIIRTSGEKRTSGFMPLQSAYAEFYFADAHFPDFDVKEFRKALDDFAKRNRRFGGESKK